MIMKATDDQETELFMTQQNDIFLESQNIEWKRDVENYNAELALEQYHKGEIEFESGKKVLDFFNDVNASPWLSKDPRYVQI